MPLKQVMLSRPKDESLEAFKAWINDIYKHITGKDGSDSMSEEKWRERWQEFWKKHDEVSKL